MPIDEDLKFPSPSDEDRREKGASVSLPLSETESTGLPLMGPGPAWLSPISGRPTGHGPASPPKHATATTRKLPQAIWRLRGIWLALLAVALASVGQSMLFQSDALWRGIAYLAGGLLLAAVAWSGDLAPPLLLVRLGRWRRGQWREFISWRRGLVIRFVGIVGAVSLAVASMYAWTATPDAFFGWQGVLWIAAMALLVLSCMGWYPRKESTLALGPPWTRGELLLFASLLAFSLFTRLAWLSDIPWRIDPDEHTAFAESMRFVQNSPTLSLFTTTWFNTGMPSLWLAAEGGMMRLAGTGLDGVRLWTALTGALAVIPVYALARQEWGRATAAFSGLAVGALAVFVHYSRVSMPNVGPPLWWATCFFFLLRGLRSRRPGDFVWAGLAAGTSMYTFYSTRTLPFLLLAFSLYLLVFQFRVFRERLGHFVLLVISFFIGFGPLLAYFQQNPQMWLGRATSELVTPLHIPANWDGWVAAWTAIAPQLQANLLGVSVVPSQDGVFFAPLLLPAEAVLLVLGLGVLLWRWRHPGAFLILLWMGSLLFLNSLVIASGKPNPNLAHWSNLLPAVCISLALPAACWLSALRRLSYRGRVAGGALMAGGVAWFVWANAYFYLVTYPPSVPAEAYNYGMQGRYLSNVPGKTVVRFVANSYAPLNLEVAELMAHNTPAGQFFNPSRDLPLSLNPGYDTDFVFTIDTLGYLPILQNYYPEGRVEVLTAPGAIPVITIYHVKAAYALAHYGVRTALFDGSAASETAKSIWQGNTSTVGAGPSTLQFVYPLSGTWSGRLYIPVPEQVALSTTGAQSSRIWVLGEEITRNTTLHLDAGWVPFTVQGELTGPGTLHLMIQENGGAPSEVGVARLWPESVNSGLAVTITGPTGILHRIDPFIGSALSGTFLFYNRGWLPSDIADQVFKPTALAASGPNAPVGSGNVSWQGEFYSDGTPTIMQFRTDAPTQLIIDGKTVLRTCGGTLLAANNPVQLSTGWHSVHIDFEPGLGTKGLEWLISQPDGTLEIVPSSRLRYNSGTTANAAIVWPDTVSTIVCTP